MTINWKAVFLCLVVSLGIAWGQGQVGTLNGTILDSSGAVVPGTTVVATNVATRVESRTTSTSAGAYTLPYLPSGTYSLRVSAPGFKTATQENVILRVGQVQTVNITIEVGAVTEEVTVTAEAPLLESGSAEIGRYITTEEYKAWPIFVSDGQRQIQEFIFSSLPGTTGGTFKGSINGGQEYSHEILIEGIPVGRADLSGGNNNEFSPSAEAIGEFKMATGAIGAQYNGGQTAVANFSIKSGTNDIHGSAFYYGQNEALNAKNLAAKTQGLKKGRLREHNYGYSVGGPVYIPKVYDGRNRTFFFTNFEKDHRDELTFNGFVTLPTTDFKAGNFSRLFDPNFTLNSQSGTVIGQDALGRDIRFGQIYDPLSTRLGPDGNPIRDPFVGNVIPQSQWNPVAANVISQVGIRDPDFNTMVRNTNRIGTSSPFFDLHIIAVKGDHNISDRHRISGYYNHSNRDRNNNGSSRYLPIPGTPTSSWQRQVTPGRMVRLSLNSTISPSVINRLAGGYNRFGNQNGAPPETVGVDWAGKIGIQNTADSYFPTFSFSGREWLGGSVGRMGVGFYGTGTNGSWVVQDDLTWIRGSHSFRFGYEFKRYFYDTVDLSGPGAFTFASRSTDLPGYIDQTGHAFASFLLGAVDSANRGITTVNPAFRQPHHAFYAMDDWKLTPRLTMNLGLRWEIIPSFYEVDNQLSYIDLDTPNPEAGNLPGALVFGRKPHDTYWRMFGPRLGFAYQAGTKMVVRGGYAMTNTPPIRNDWGYGGFTYGFNGGITVRARSSPTGFVDDPAMYLNQRFPDFRGTLPNTDPASGNFDASQTTARDANRPGYVQNWNLTIQYQLPQDTVLEVAYVGNKGTRLWGSFVFGEMNGLPATLLSRGDTLIDQVGDHPEFKPYADFPDDATVAQAMRPFPQYYSVQEAFPYNSNSNYHAFQTTVTKHLTKGLSFLGAYTWSKTITYVDSNGPGAYYATVQDYFNRGLERSIASFHYPHSFKLTWVYDIPVGKGKRWDLGPANYVIGGWQFAAVQNYRSGDPISIGQSGISAPDGFSGGIRPDVTGQQYSLGGAPTKVDYTEPTPYLNAAAFVDSPRTGNGVPLRVGTAPRFIDGVRGPHFASEDFRMTKAFPLYERVNLKLGMTMSNPFNRTNRYFVTTTVGDSGFGQLLQGGGGRTIQLDARIEW
ncbi:MAG: TonB-dependent receptor [Bryobacteraceae bacterium]|nr:TonB-dependent receptor [Bryobacteraceae bacterium]